MSEKIKYWWSEDRQWFCIRIKGETASLTVAEAEELMGEVQQTPSFLALQEEAAQRAVELMEQSRATAGSERIDIVERLRFDATRCELQFSKGVAGNINDAAAEIERLRGLVPTPAQAPVLLDALREAERFMAYFSGETDGVFVGPGTPQACLAHIRYALTAQPPAAPVETPRIDQAYELAAKLRGETGDTVETRPFACKACGALYSHEADCSHNSSSAGNEAEDRQ